MVRSKTPPARADEPKTVQLYRLQDRFITPFMGETEAQSLLDGYPGEYVRWPIEQAAPEPDEA